MTRRRKLPAVVRAVAAGGAVMFWVVQLTLLLVAGMPVADTVLLAVLLVAVPAFSLAQLPLIDGAVVERIPAYWGSIVTLWLLGSACWLVGTRADGAAAVGIVGIPLRAMVTWTLVLTAGGLAIVGLFRGIAIRVGADESPLLRQLLPKSAAEKRVFSVLSLAAGVGEELAYRGYAIPVLAPLLGVGGAAVLTSVVFGVLHSYQGLLGTLRTALMGGVLAWGFLVSGSLWPAIIAHTLIDLLAGLVLGEKLLPPRRVDGVGEEPDLQSSGI